MQLLGAGWIEQGRSVLLEVTKPAISEEPAAWLSERIVGFAANVMSVVPTGFDKYARLFHPASRDPGDHPVTWSEVAGANQRVPHRQMQWPSITGDMSFIQRDTQPGLWDGWPSTGSLPGEIARPLVDVLANHTATPDRCWFAVWEGWGALPDELRQVPTFELPHRRYHLLSGPISAILESAEPPPWEQSANLWWPEDHAWCVATEIDFMTTYLAVSTECFAELKGVPSLEILAADPTDATTWASDTINPTTWQPDWMR